MDDVKQRLESKMDAGFAGSRDDMRFEWTSCTDRLEDLEPRS